MEVGGGLAKKGPMYACESAFAFVKRRKAFNFTLELIINCSSILVCKRYNISFINIMLV